MATESERNILASEILGPIFENSQKVKPRKLTVFLPLKGDRYSGKLMIVGRAVNGWRTTFDFDEPQKLRTPQEIAEDVYKKSIGGDGKCPMSWVSDLWREQKDKYNTKRSAFWRVTRGIVEGLGIAKVNDDTWPSHLVWSNLYKVSPDKGGNPSNKLCDIQWDGCLSLLKAELEEYRPERLLFYTGWNWARSFLSELAPHIEPVRGNYVKATGKVEVASGVMSRVVVAVHPMKKKEKELVSEVVKGFGG